MLTKERCIVILVITWSKGEKVSIVPVTSVDEPMLSTPGPRAKDDPKAKFPLMISGYSTSLPPWP